jgi:diguanylate cyclase (GGDEF)-like protein
MSLMLASPPIADDVGNEQPRRPTRSRRAPPPAPSGDSARRARRAALQRRRRLRFARLFVLIALLPLGAAAVVLSFTAARTERQRTQLSLESAVRLAAFSLARQVDAADSRAVVLASSPSVQRALARRDRAALQRLVARDPRLSFTAGSDFRVGRVSGPAAVRSAGVRIGELVIGRVSVAVRFDHALVAGAAARSGLPGAGTLALVEAGRVVAGTELSPSAPLSVRLGGFRRVQLDGREYVAYAAPVVRGSAQLVGLVPESHIGAQTARRRLLLVLSLLASLAALGGLGYMVAPAVGRGGRPRRRPDSREAANEPTGRDVREMLALVGDTLAATHNPEALLPVILEAMMEATRARGGRLLREGKEVARAGTVDTALAPLALELEVEGAPESLLLLYPPPQGFSENTRELARSLVAQAATALENAHLHSIVKWQAVTDDLTQLTNRRGFMQALESEVRRSDRFGGSLSLILLDLDDFKLINDRHGHHTGDEVLREVAKALLNRVRDVDVPVRLGGEEFAVLLPQTDLVGCTALAENLRAEIESVRLAAVDRVKITASFGVVARTTGEGAHELLQRADVALYRAKGSGKNRVVADDDPPAGLSSRASGDR